MKEYTVIGMALHRATKVPFVVLKELHGPRSFPIPVGPLEASSILIELEGESLPRPSAHDLLAHFFLRHHFKMQQSVISHIDDELSFAHINYTKGSESFSIEALPADAIAIALRLGAPICLTDEAAADALDKSFSDVEMDSKSYSYLFIKSAEELHVQSEKMA